ncbi:hypothetical protein CENSYa_1112 [Cenarchaeum symbiosum A]|uniref:Uncharacterized protein n=1 Tax=Cenarchaeum symbiosum (strain A) TaxID=414004 RepID=A0RWM4_CENSY|nr:hypothetical protein CENSYa_1112 [Cenarchaeum symbiosum A]
MARRIFSTCMDRLVRRADALPMQGSGTSFASSRRANSALPPRTVHNIEQPLVLFITLSKVSLFLEFLPSNWFPLVVDRYLALCCRHTASLDNLSPCPINSISVGICRAHSSMCWAGLNLYLYPSFGASTQPVLPCVGPDNLSPESSGRAYARFCGDVPTDALGLGKFTLPACSKMGHRQSHLYQPGAHNPMTGTCAECDGPIGQKYEPMKDWKMKSPLCGKCYSKGLFNHYPGDHVRVNLDLD